MAEDGKLFLAERLGEGTRWDIEIPGTGAGDEGKRAVIRAAVGQMKGWYLGMVEVREVGENGKGQVAFQLVLAKEPPRKMVAGRIVNHK